MRIWSVCDLQEFILHAKVLMRVLENTAMQKNREDESGDGYSRCHPFIKNYIK